MHNAHERLAVGQMAPYFLLSLPVVGLKWYNMQVRACSTCGTILSCGRAGGGGGGATVAV